MAFSEELAKKLEQAWKDKKEISVFGVNSIGDKFTTTGRITTTDKGESAVYALDEAVFLEFGQSKDSPNRKQTSYFAPFQAKYTEDSNYEFFIINIRIDGVVVFENPQTKYILKETAKVYLHCAPPFPFLPLL